MVLRVVAGARIGEDADDLLAYLAALEGGPAVTRTALVGCTAHGDEPGWSYLEADPQAGVARRRCLACGASTPLLDSDEHWTHPPMWACRGCGQSIAELAVGVAETDGLATWVAVGARCVGCGRVDGVTDLVVDPQPVEQLLPRL